MAIRVRWAQRRLGIRKTGSFDAATEGAVRDLQDDNDSGQRRHRQARVPVAYLARIERRSGE